MILSPAVVQDIEVLCSTGSHGKSKEAGDGHLVKMNRRSFLRTSIAAGVVTSAGCLGGLTGGANQQYTDAVQAYNRAGELRGEALTTGSNAADAWEVEDWGRAESLYLEAENTYERAADKAGEARSEASGCQELSNWADNLFAYCSPRARAMSSYAQAADQYGKGNFDQGDEYVEEAQAAADEADNVDVVIRREVEAENLDC
jgi:hypothetical protein